MAEARPEAYPSQERLHEVLGYDPETGKFHWKTRPPVNRGVKSWNKRFAGTEAGQVNPNGYLQVCVDYRKFLSHRLAWALRLWALAAGIGPRERRQDRQPNSQPASGYAGRKPPYEVGPS